MLEYHHKWSKKSKYVMKDLIIFVNTKYREKHTI